MEKQDNPFANAESRNDVSHMVDLESYTPDKTKMLDVLQRQVIRSLFYETTSNKNYTLYTWKDHDISVKGVHYISISRAYMEMEDVTEIDFARKYFLSYSHWEAVCNTFPEEVAKLRKELQLQLNARMFKNMKELADAGNYNANKAIYDATKDPETRKKTGKKKLEPSKGASNVSSILQRVKA